VSSDLGVIVAAHGRHYEVLTDSGATRQGYPRGKRSEFVCGDRVALSAEGQMIMQGERHSLLYRSDAFRQKLIAANASQLVLVVATNPSFSTMLLSRALAAAEDQQLQCLIVLNKTDLVAALPEARAALKAFAQIGYEILEICAHAESAAAELAPRLAGQRSVLVGQSGMGKSTLLNALVPDAKRQTREISHALDSGKHTTTSARLYHLGHGTADWLIDSPGLQEFGLAHLDAGAIEAAFVEFRPLLGKCRYRNCRHDREPGCAVQAAVADGQIDALRLEHFRQLTRLG
jgi:ribosome biogenesis GTPase